MSDSKNSISNPEPASWLDALLLLGVFLFMTMGIGNYGLYEPHEAHFAGVGREMVTRGDWITPHLNGAPYLNKPPLMYWMIALCHSIFGISEFSARLPLAVIGWVGTVIAWDWARRLWGLAAGRTAAVMLTATAGWYLFSHQLMIELLLMVLYFASLYFFWRAILEPENLWRWVPFHLAISLNLMAKGPVGVAFIFLVICGYAAVRGKWQIFKQCRPLLGVAMGAVIVLPWLIPIELRNPGYLKYVILNENVKRALDMRWPPDYSVVKVSWYIFVAATVVWMTPWSLLLPQVVSFTWKKSRGINEPEPQAVKDGILILALGSLACVAFFLPIPARLVYYGLPALPPFVVLSAGWWTISRGDCYAKGRSAAAIALLIVGTAVFSAGFWITPLLKNEPNLAAAPQTIQYVDEICFIIGASLASGGLLLVFRKPGLAVASLSLLYIVACGYNLLGFAAFDEVRSSKRYVEALRDKLGEECIWVSEGSKEIGASAGISFYLGQNKNGQARSAYIMEDDPRREPPAFPGFKPQYLINHAKLRELWLSDNPVIFVTDFGRTDWLRDPPWLPSEPDILGRRAEWFTGKEFAESIDERYRVQLQAGHRRIYANRAAFSKLSPGSK